MANSQHKYLLERGWSQQQIDEVIRKAHEWLRGAGYTPLTEQGHWNGIMGNTQSYHLPSREKDARGMTEAFVEMLKGGKILDASRVHKFSRPGQPDTMSKSDGNYFVIRGYMDGMIMGERSFDTQREAEFYGKQMLEYMKKQYPKAKKITVDIDSTVNHAPGPKIKTLASRPGAKDTMASHKESFQKEYILWALPKGETDRLHERPIAEGITTPQQMDDAKRKAASQGWHGFRVQILDMSKPFRWMSRPGAKDTMAVEDRFYFGKERFAENVTYTVASFIGSQPVGQRSVKSLDEAKTLAKQMLASAKASANGQPVVVDVYPVVNYEPKDSILALRA